MSALIPLALPEIWSVEQAINQLGPQPVGLDIASWGLWYRGHSDSTWGLIPSAHSRNYTHTVDERNLAYDFRLRNDGERHHKAKSVFDLLCTMQHYGAPTRLLDWSESLLVGLFFAVKDQAEWGKPGALYVLNAFGLNSLTSYSFSNTILPPEDIDVTLRAAMAISQNLEDILDLALNGEPSGWFSLRCNAEFLREFSTALFDAEHRFYTNARNYFERLRHPVAVFPKRNNPRLIAQAGVFTVHGGKEYPAGNVITGIRLPEPVSMEAIPAQQPFQKYIIPSHSKPHISKQLTALGITESFLFPELDFQLKEQKARWGSKIKQVFFQPQFNL